MPRDPSEVLDEDRIRLTHMLDSARRARRFCTGKAREDLERDDLLLFAVLKAIEVIGEASTKISEDTRTRLPAIDWLAVRRTRNRLIHGYDTINTAIVWETVRLSLGPLIDELERILAAWPSV